MAYADILNVDIVSVDYFVSNLLPPISETLSIEVLIQDIKERDLLYEEAGKLIWKCFGDDDKEDQRPSMLKDVFKSVVSSARKLCNLQDTHFFSVNSSATRSLVGENNRPGAFIVKKRTESVAGYQGEISRFDVACIGEFQKGDGENNASGNVLKGMQHMLASDATRRFVYGFTVEKENMSLWHASRAALLKCDFDYKRDHRKLIYFFISIAFANANGQETGWDPTVTKLGLDRRKNMRCQFDVRGKKYRTMKKLADYAADGIAGRGTRVFLVEEEETKEIHVLKDLWMDSDRPRESEIIKKLLAAVEAICGPEARKFVEEHMVTILEEIVVQVDGRDDDTQDVIMRGAIPHVEWQERLYKDKKPEKSRKRSVGPMQSFDSTAANAPKPQDRIQPQAQAQRKSMRRMKHCRVVYKEYATPIHKLKKLSDVVKALLGANRALRYIHKAGWVHRDISAGNIYLYGDEGLLADFEYAKEMGTAAEHEVKTGTIIYMAYEAIKREFANLKIVAALFGPPVVFFHNPLHDMESTFWIYAASLMDVENKNHEYGAWQNISYGLFSGLDIDASNRFQFVFGNSHVEGDYVKLLGRDRIKLFLTLSRLKDELVNCYKESEEALPHRPINREKFNVPQEKFEAIWKDCLEYLSANDEPLDRSVSKLKADTEVPLKEQKKKRTKHEHEPRPDEGDNVV